MGELDGVRAVVLAEEDYQELEVWYPVLRFREAGADVTIAAPQTNHTYESQLGYPLMATALVNEIDPAAVDVVVVPGGKAGERLRESAAAIQLVADVHGHGGTTAAVGEGAGVFAAAGLTPDATGSDVTARVIVAATVDELPALFAGIRTAVASTEVSA